MHISASSIPKTYIWRRVHSIFGLMIVLFLIEHLLTNSQAALLLGDNGEGFIRSVNFIKNLPYLPVIELVLIGVPILVHAGLGIRYLMTAKFNAWPSKGDKPSLPQYSRNHAYSWQRITSWILLVGIVSHVGYMRFYRYPDHAQVGDKEFYFTKVDIDPGLYTVAARLGVKLYTKKNIEEEEAVFNQKRTLAQQSKQEAETIEKQYEGMKGIDPIPYQMQMQKTLKEAQTFRQKEHWLKVLSKTMPTTTEVVAVSPDFGTATLVMVRDAFKSPFKGGLYTIFVLAACFHAFNGLWTFCITWGWVIKARSQAKLVNFCTIIMVVIALLGLTAIWGTYWMNLPR